MADKEEFDWNTLANQGASAANLLRAFEYAEQVFKNISRAEQILKSSAEEFNALQEEIKQLKIDKQSIVDATKTEQNVLITKRKEEIAAFNIKHEIAIGTQKQELEELKESVLTQSMALEVFKTEREAFVTKYKNEVSNWEERLTKMKAKYREFIDSLPKKAEE